MGIGDIYNFRGNNAQALINYHKCILIAESLNDFSAFSVSRGEDEKLESKVRKVWKVEIFEEKEEVQVVVEGSGFLYKMVRSMVGALLDVGTGKLKTEEIEIFLKSKIPTVSSDIHKNKIIF